MICDFVIPSQAATALEEIMENPGKSKIVTFLYITIIIKFRGNILIISLPQFVNYSNYNKEAKISEFINSTTQIQMIESN